ncbi:hypothetical protein BDR06DRAFT_1054389 [Suillus hirtellus]|nr:hypothetical protein BDR06DRAFT_1054389 [Suillus hirtellus]
MATDAHYAQRPDTSPKPPHPFPNMTTYRLMTWMNSGSHHKSEAEVSRLVKDVIQADDFNARDLDGFSVRKSLCALDHDNDGKKGTCTFPDDWLETDITLDIPTKSRDDPSKSFTVPGFHYRLLLGVIRSVFTDVQANAFHLLPFKRLWKDPLDDGHQRVFDELYTSDSWLQAQDDLQWQPREPNCTLEHVIAGLMFFSDATHLATFGTAKAWPLYLYFGNLTKYACSAPKSGACHLIRFLPLLPDSVKDVLSSLPRILKTGIAALHTHCRRDLFHACWKHLLDADFLEAYRHGIVLRCPDGILRRVFPRIFTYSADYPEKVLIATIKDMGSCLCPRCLTPKASFYLLGLLKDMRSRIGNLRTYCLDRVTSAQGFIYGLGNTINGSKVQATLGEGSWVPTVNTFAEKLGHLGFDTFRMLVVNFMHECELGTWKALFTHLIRLLYACPGGKRLVATLDNSDDTKTKFRHVPSYGNGIIQTFSNNTSEMKRLAARDFEDILQCAMPVFEGLFLEGHDELVQSLLYRFALWHTLAKLRIHSDTTLSVLEETFKQLSHVTCAAFTTLELPKEKAAQDRKAAHERSCANNPDITSSGRKTKKFNLSTYKFHAMGNYLQSIQLFGTTDSFTSQIGELVHRALKAFYPLTNKLDTPAQLAKHKCRCCVLRQVAESDHSLYASKQVPVDLPVGFKDHHHIPKNYNNPLHIFTFLRDHGDDLAVALDISHCDHVFMDDERNSVIISDSRLYSVQTMQVHYTTYDLRREYDTINPRTHCDIMVLSGETRPQHPYWYARVLDIYHVDVWLSIEATMKRHQIEVLYVRWMAPLADHRSGMSCAKLPKVAFVDKSDHDAYGWLDPGQVIRSAHLIPAFASGRGTTSLCYGKSFARQSGDLDDWEAYYVGIFVDRDMLMRYTPHGIGHPTVVWEILQNCTNAELMDSALCEHNIQPCEADVEQGGSDDDDEGESDDGDDDDDSEESDVQDSDDQEMEDGEGEEDDFVSF